MKSLGGQCEAQSEGFWTTKSERSGVNPEACHKELKGSPEGDRDSLGNGSPEVDTKAQEVGTKYQGSGCYVRRSDTKKSKSRVES